MIIGVPKEIKAQEFRVALTPSGADMLIRSGHQVRIEREAGKGSGFSDEDYITVGALIDDDPKAIYSLSDMIVKVKEPQEQEYQYLHDDLVLFAYLHLASDPDQANALLQKGVIGIAYETVQLPNRTLPLLSPMSEVAGRMAIQVGAHLLEKNGGGRGILLGGATGVEKASVVVLGGGTVGTNAIKMAYGLGAKITVIDNNSSRLAYLDDIFDGHIETLISTPYNIERALINADLVIGAILIPGAKAPKIVKEYMVKQMKSGSVIVDVAIDQGGSIETIDRITTHLDPYFVKHGVIHYSVANIPGAVPRTSTFALTNATLPYIMNIANKGVNKALSDDPNLLQGLSVYKGKLTSKPVSESLGMMYTPVNEVITV